MESFKGALGRYDPGSIVRVQMSWVHGAEGHILLDERTQQRHLLEKPEPLASFEVSLDKTLYVAQAFFWAMKHSSERPYCVRPTDVDFYVKWNKKAKCPVPVWWEIPNDPTALKWPDEPLAKIEGAVTLLAGYKGKSSVDRIGFHLEGFLVPEPAKD